MSHDEDLIDENGVKTQESNGTKVNSGESELVTVVGAGPAGLMLA